MNDAAPPRRRVWLARGCGVALIAVPLAAAVHSPLGASREAAWVAGSLLGVLALALLPIQALLPQRSSARRLSVSLRLHRVVGLLVLAATLGHVAALYVVSPDDIGDALVLQAPTYSRLGVISAVGLIVTIAFALLRPKLGLDEPNWRVIHGALAIAIVGTGVAHALMIRGALDGPIEIALCAAAVLAVAFAVFGRAVLRVIRSAQSGG